MTDSQTLAGIADKATTDFLREILEATAQRDRPEALTGALYGVIRVMHAMRPRNMDASEFAFSVLGSATTAITQLDPSPDLRAELKDGDAESAFLQLMGETANTMTQQLADNLHDRAAGGPCCPMSGIVPGLLAGAAYVAVNNRDREQTPTPAEIRPFIMGVVDAVLEEAAVLEAADAMGEALGHG